MSKKPIQNFKSLGEIVIALANMLKPPERLSVAEAAAKYRFVNQPGAYVGKWMNETTPYMVEPMDTFASRDYKGLVFVGPAQSGKTDALIINTILYSVKVDPMDMILFCPTMGAARDFSARRVDRLHMHSREVGAMLLPSRDADNTYDKHYTSGMMLTLSWPSVTEVAGRPVGRVVITDYDRIPDMIGGDGSLYDLASKRTTTFGSFAMTLAESSPSREIDNPKWIPRTRHEAPPAGGILALYNRGDRRRLYWPCLSCETWYEATFEHMRWDDTLLTNIEKAETAKMACPYCNHHHGPDDKPELLAWATWVQDGITVDQNGRKSGTPLRSSVASFWLNGVAATFASWRDLTNAYLDAMDEFETTRSEAGLRKFYNNDLAEPYLPKAMASDRVPETLKTQAVTSIQGEVPPGVRFIVATVDVQKNMFVVQVHGVMPGTPFDTVIIDRFDIIKSKRVDIDGDTLWVKPATYAEDWNLVEEQVINRTYPLADGSGRHMRVRFTGCDSGGKEGVTSKAYEFYRSLRATNSHGRFVLLKGDPSPRNPRTRISYPDSGRKDDKSAARGDIPVLMLNSNIIKDDLDGRLDSLEPGKGRFIMATWMPDATFGEMCAEVRTPKGWENPGNRRNETFDLAYYHLGICVSPLLRVEMIDWDNPPTWAKEWDENDLVVAGPGKDRFASSATQGYDFAKLAAALA